MTRDGSPTRHQWLEKAIDRLGQYGLPQAVSRTVGHWASDFGTPWLPHML